MNFTIIPQISQFFEAVDQNLRNTRLKNVFRSMNKNQRASDSLFGQGLVHKDKRISKSLLFAARLKKRSADKALSILSKRRGKGNDPESSSVYTYGGTSSDGRASRNTIFWANYNRAGKLRRDTVKQFGLKTKKIGQIAANSGSRWALNTARFERRAAKPKQLP